jgi:diaminopimelate decarboxylase
MSAEPTFQYRSGQLHCEDVPAAAIAERFGTPCYVYSAGALRGQYGRIRDAFAAWRPTVCFSIKSCSNLSILKLLAGEGSGFDVVSGGELYRALAAGADPAMIVYAGVGKTDAEIEYALREGILMFNVESRPELEHINAVAQRLGRRARAAVRVNPDVDPRTHAKTTTGKGGTKFGIGIDGTEKLFAEADRLAAVEVCGIHLHLGSPIYSTEPYERALEKVSALIERLRAAGRRVEWLNTGGGYCISYTGEEVVGPRDYAAAMGSYLEKSGCAVIIEPGRYIAGNSAVLLTQVVYRKETQFGKRFLVCDAAMNDLVRPTLYDAYHRIWPVASPQGMPAVLRPQDEGYEGFATETFDVVGPVCETGDYLAKGRPLPQTQEGQVLAVFSAGAYGFTMSSNYNSRPRAAEVLVDGAEARLVRRRESWADLVEPEREYL